jgi:predicted PurR-regulated permease PerM
MTDPDNNNLTNIYVNRILRVGGTLVFIAAGIYFIWKFSFILVYILVAAIVSSVGHPVVRLLDKIRIAKVKMPHSLSAVITLLLLLTAFISLFAIFVPLIIQQAQTVAKIDINKLASQLQEPLAWLQQALSNAGMIPEGQTIEQYIAVKAQSLVNMTSISSALNTVLDTAGSFLINLFSIIFIAFFFLKDENMFQEIILSIAPEKHQKATYNVLHESKRLLRRYFTGVVFEILGGMTLITCGLLILGVDNALLLGFFGGLMNIIPYIGPILGTALGLTLGFTGALATGDFTSLWPLFLKIAGVFFTIHYLDSMLYQPIIYSSSVKAHPLEVFIAIIIGGTAYGIVGMLLAMPVYTVLRVIAKEFFNKFRVVQKLTETI